MAESASNSQRLLVLQQDLQALRQQGAEQTDPLTFYYLEALSEKLAQRAHLADTVRQSLLDKADQRLRHFKEKSQEKPQIICQAATAQAVQKSERKSALHLLKQLNRQFEPAAQLRDSAAQEAHGNKHEVTSDPLPRAELQSLRHYQQLFEKMAVERLLNKVMQEIPDNAGPLNPERMVIRCLSAVQEISPVYVMRLMGYYEALISLQTLPLNEK